METKEQLLAFSIANFTQFGSKSFTMDELARKLGISKKTIYHYFSNKEELVTESLQFLLDKVEKEIDTHLNEGVTLPPITKVVYIYKVGLKHMRSFSPSFLYGLKKYYPKAYDTYDNFRKKIVLGVVHNLLKEAQEQKHIRADVNLKLVCELYLIHMENIVFSHLNLWERYTVPELHEHLIVNNLKGILTFDYTKECHLLKHT